jgi:hypothetical protein
VTAWIVQIKSHDPDAGGGDDLFGPFRSEAAADAFAEMAQRHVPTAGSGWNPTWITVRPLARASLRSIDVHGWTVDEIPLPPDGYKGNDDA